MARRRVPAMVVVAMVLVACGDRIGEPTMRTASPEEARCATSPFAQDPGQGHRGLSDLPNSTRPPGERLLLCWYDGPIGIPGGGNPPADRFVIVLGDDLVQFLAAGPRTSLPITSDPP